jgi:hypothetical protein
MYSPTGGLQIWKHNVLGLRSALGFYLFPTSLEGFQMVFAVYNPSEFDPARIRVLDPAGKELFYIDLGVEIESRPESLQDGVVGPYLVPSDFPTWMPFAYSLQEVSALIERPGLYKVVLTRNDEDIPLGCLNVGYVEVPPLTQDRIAAIRSNPYATKRIRFFVRCNECGDEIVGYVGLERSEDEVQGDAIWYKELPAMFRCKCGKSEIDLRYLRANLHAVLGRTNVNAEERIPSTHLSFVRLYEESALESVCGQFDQLLGNEPPEIEILQFIRENPILLHRFSPTRIFFEVPILSRYRADIVILTTNHDLLLIEIERADTRLLKMDGGMASPMRHAFDQVRDWLHMIENHKLAVLECIGLEPDEVSAIRGVVILGRDADYSPKHLRRLRWEDYGRTAFYTYDDILRDLMLLRRSFGSL